MSYRLVALDIDGTIRSPEYPLSDRTRKTLSLVMDAGAYVTIATGRMFRSAVEATKDLDLRSPIASFQGAHVADPATGEVLWHRPLEPSMAREALDAVAPWGLDVMAYHSDQVYIREMTPGLKAYGERNRVIVNAVGDLSALAEKGLTRLVVEGGEDEIERLERSLKERFDSTLYVTRSLPRFCEILHPEGGKDKALGWLCDYLGVGQEDTIAFGNGYNDVQMLQWAALGVAVAGAVPQVIEVADRTAPPIEEDGVAHVLEQLLDQGLIG
ncbi:MAG: HAD family phosphatase [Chloroflexi bacterium]|nr:HAD family phosphatase [Chloroflexota bacterium]